MTDALTVTATGIAHALRSSCTVSRTLDPGDSDPGSPRFPCRAVWDTGATMSVIDWRVVEECRPPQVTVTEIRTIHGTERMPLHLVTLELPNGIAIPGLRVIAADLGDAEVLIGMDVITRGDFALTNADGFTQFSFRTPSQEHIDFVAETDRGLRPSDPPTP